MSDPKKNEVPNELPASPNQETQSRKEKKIDLAFEDFFLSGSKESFDLFYARNYLWILSFVKRVLPANMVGRDQLAEDLVQDSLIDVYRAKERGTGWVPGRASPHFWLKRILLNKSISNYHRKKRPEILDTDLSSPSKFHQEENDTHALAATLIDSEVGDPSEIASDADSLAWIVQKMRTQPEVRRKVFHMLLRDKKKSKEVAAELGISLSTTSRHISKLCNLIQGWHSEADRDGIC
jgi:RNA polymerase sigma factor (sigma-70 family)